MTSEEVVIFEAIRLSRKIQEFLWGNLSFTKRKYEPKEWKAAFQKRIDKIDQIDFSNPSAIVELRKRLLQQAALSIKALIVLQTNGKATTEETRNICKHKGSENKDKGTNKKIESKGRGVYRRQNKPNDRNRNRKP